ncbi:MAG: hypothetical protein V3S13_01835 [Candidatus Omnitrophota bacterium]
MKTIVISGSHSNIGKTSLAEEMLGGMRNWSALKVTRVRAGSRCPRDNGCTACSELNNDFDIIADEKIINKKDTDTARMKKAGAKKVIWLKANTRGMKQGLKKSLSYLRGSEGVVIEGTSVLRYIKPSLAIFITGKDKTLRPAARLALKKADIVYGISR